METYIEWAWKPKKRQKYHGNYVEISMDQWMNDSKNTWKNDRSEFFFIQWLYLQTNNLLAQYVRKAIIAK